MIKEFIPLQECLTDFKGCEEVFAKAFEDNEQIGHLIKNVLELGVYRYQVKTKENLDYPGQSTKTLFILKSYFNFDYMISLDIDDCRETIERCKKWVGNLGLKIPEHQFVQCNSIHFNIQDYFPNGIDFIFLDTNHDDNYPEKIGYKNAGGKGMTYKEICYYAPYLSLNGRMFLHDTFMKYVEEKSGYNTMGAVSKFIDENKDDYVFVEHNTNLCGLGEIVRKNSEISNYLGYKNE